MDAQAMMARIRTGVPEIDGCHASLLKCLGEVITSSAQAPAAEHSIDALLELRNLCKAHFEQEEAFMIASHYNDIDEHRRLHRSELTLIDRIIQEARANGGQPDQNSVSLMATWLHEHMRTMDIELAEAIRAYRGSRRK